MSPFYSLFRCVKGTDGVANGVKPEQSDLGSRYLQKHFLRGRGFTGLDMYTILVEQSEKYVIYSLMEDMSGRP